MATVPSATTSLQDTAGAQASGLDLVCVLAPVPQTADLTPRIHGNAASVYALHGYSEGLEYVALHAERTRKGVLFVPMPIGTAGAVGRVSTAGNTGSSAPSVAAGGSGVLGEHEGWAYVERGGTIGTDQITLLVSLDGGRNKTRVKLGTASSYTIPYIGVVLSFAAGTLVAGDVCITWFGSGPRVSNSDLATARTNLANMLKFFRSAILIGDLQNSTDASAFVTQLNAYETANQRFIKGRASVKDRLPYARMSQDRRVMTGSPSLTFAEVGASGDTITRATGSWLADGFAVNDVITVTGTSGNNVTGPIASLSATVITLGTTDLNAEVTSNATIVADPGLTFAEVGATGDTITRSRGSWLSDGFRVGDLLTITGTASNNITGVSPITGVTATVLTLGSDDLAAEVIGNFSVVLTAGQTKAAWMASIDAAFASIDAQKRIDMSAGRARIRSPFLQYEFRRPAAWDASLREYQNDLHIPTWRKSDGPTGADLFDTGGNLVEWDDRADGGAGSAARFTTYRTYSNGPAGAFITQSLTRDVESSLLSQSHNLDVANLTCTQVQLSTENIIGQVLQLNADGTATADSRALIESQVNADLERVLLTNTKGQGPRASSVVWSMATTDVLNVPDAVINGTAKLNLNGTVHDVITKVRVLSNGAQ